MHRVECVYILAGGKSSRFGENKALVSIFGEPLIVRLANQLASMGLGLRIVAQRTSDYEGLGFPVIEDQSPDAGPLAGLLAALCDCERLGSHWCLVSSCDILDWHPEWFQALIQTVQRNPQLDAAILEGINEEIGAFRPFPGLYRASLWNSVTEFWNNGDRSMRKLHDRIKMRIEKCRVESCRLPKCFNTPQELEKLLGEKA